MTSSLLPDGQFGNAQELEKGAFTGDVVLLLEGASRHVYHFEVAAMSDDFRRTEAWGRGVVAAKGGRGAGGCVEADVQGAVEAACADRGRSVAVATFPGWVELSDGSGAIGGLGTSL